MTQAAHPDDAFNYLVDFLRQTPSNSTQPWWDFEISAIANRYFVSSGGKAGTDTPQDVGRAFYDAAWRLCRMGILRPTINFPQLMLQTVAPFPGSYYSVTLAGREWLKTSDLLYVPSDPARYVSLLSKEIDILGQGFAQRAREAAACHQSGNYLACCAMCGAAAESAILRAAITKAGDENGVLEEYVKPNGRRRIMEMIFGAAPSKLEERFISSAFSLLVHWRDETAHGQVSAISELEAYHSLTALVRFAQFLFGSWDSLLNARRGR
jgi:hypothetical protein